MGKESQADFTASIVKKDIFSRVTSRGEMVSKAINRFIRRL